MVMVMVMMMIKIQIYIFVFFVFFFFSFSTFLFLSLFFFSKYTMLKDVNDTPEDATALIAFLTGIQAKVNLIPFNSHQGTSFTASDDATIQDFRSRLIAAGLVCTTRASRGDDEMAACGQLGDGRRLTRP